MMMTCSFTGRPTDFPVMSKTTGHVYEKEEIEKHIRDYGKCPVTGRLLTMDDIKPIIMRKVPVQAPNGSFSSNSKTAAEESSCPRIPPRIAKEIKVTRRELSEHRIDLYREISTSLATADAPLQGYIFNNSYTLHKTIMPGVLSMDIDNSKGIIATGGADTNAVVFDLSSRKTVSKLSGHSEKVTSVKFVNEGELVVTGSGDNTVRVWQRSKKGSYKCMHILGHHTAEVRAVTIHPTQKYFVTASFDCTWQLYDLASESSVACCKGSESFSNAVFHPDGRILGTCTSGLVRLWDVAKQDDILQIDHHKGSDVTSIAFSGNGYTLATAAGEGVKLWDLRFLRTMKTFVSSYDKDTKTRSVEFDHSGKYLATGGAHISIYETDVAAVPDPIATFSDISGMGDLSCVKFGKDAKYVAAARKLDSKLLLFGLSEGNQT